ncbi:MAG: hypothetical protein PF692_08745 [Kiritimatiellae bacterium]|jgi:hypothetical protein|nr:hypothetical protein [Kiritimatiellia bacterium]
MQLDAKSACTSSMVILECEQKAVRKFFIIDLFSKAVIHGKDGKAQVNIIDEGKTLATYSFAKEGKDIRFEISVFKDNLNHMDNMWPWGRGDNVNRLSTFGKSQNLPVLVMMAMSFSFGLLLKKYPTSLRDLFLGRVSTLKTCNCIW